MNFWQRFTRRQSDLNDEIESHLRMAAEDHAGDGKTAEQARAAAAREFGNVALVKEVTRDMWGTRWLEALLQDLRYGARMLGKSWNFTIVAVLALALGIGVNTAIFTAYEAVAQRPIQAKDPGRIVNIFRSTPVSRWGFGFTYSDYSYFNTHNHVFSGVIATAGTEVALSGAPGSPAGATASGGISGAAGFRFPQQLSGSAEFLRASFVSENFFQVLGVNPVRGRAFTPGVDGAPGASPVVMLSENFFERRFRSDPAILGRTLKLNSVAFTVIGITPRDFMGSDQNVPDLWLPATQQIFVEPGDDWIHNAEEDCCFLNARLRPGVTMQQAEVEMNLLAEQARRTHPPASDLHKATTITLRPGSPFFIRPDPVFTALVAGIMAAVGLVLLIACANVASLQLARSAARQKEFGVRLAIGAGRGRLLRQLLTESALLALLAGGVGLLLSWWTLRFIIFEISSSLPPAWGTLALQVDPNGHIFIYTILISLVAGILFGLAPALEATKVNLVSVIKEESSLGGRLSKSRMRNLLVTVQVALSVALLICAGLLVRGSARVLRMDMGFETKRVLGMDLELPPGLNYSPQRKAALIRDLMQRFQAVPGVVSVTRGRPPASGLRQTSVALDGHKLMSNGRPVTLWYNYAAASFFDTLGLPIVEGRAFTAEEARAGFPVVVISQATAKKLWPGQDPIGKRVTLDATDQFHDDLFPAALAAQVVGVSRDAHFVSLSTPDDSYVFIPLPPDNWSQNVLVRTAGDPNAFISALGNQAQAEDPNLSVFAESLDGLLTNHPEFVFSRAGAIFSTTIGLLGLFLASVGIYGMVGYAVLQRTREVGIRMALGANRREVLRLVLGQAMRPVVLGLAVGVALAGCLSSVFKMFLFGVSSLDPLTFGGVAAFLIAVALLASYLPARRATKLDPMEALRYE